MSARTQQIGRELFARLDRSGPLPLTRRWLDDQLMAFSMRDEALKVQLFRFVDTLPYLMYDPPEIARHLKEYLGRANKQLPWWVRHGVRLLPGSGVGGKLLAAATRVNATQMARKFIAGSNVPEAVAAVKRMRADENAFTIDLLGEATITEAEADAYQQQYFDLVEGLSRKPTTSPSSTTTC